MKKFSQYEIALNSLEKELEKVYAKAEKEGWTEELERKAETISFEIDLLQGAV